MEKVHRPVLLRESVHWLGCAPGKRIADVTVGLGGAAAQRARLGVDLGEAFAFLGHALDEVLRPDL